MSVAGGFVEGPLGEPSPGEVAGASPSETVSNVLDKDPVPLTTLAPQHPKGLEIVVQRLLAKLASDRYASATELAAALVPLTSPPGSLTERLRRLFLGN